MVVFIWIRGVDGKVWILVSWLYQKPIDLDLHVFPKVASLNVEAEEPSLTTRREKLSLQYAIRLAENPSNPAHEVTFPSKYTDLSPPVV